MKQTLSTGQAADILKRDEYANWSYAGAYALAEYLEEFEESMGEELELCPVAIRCDFSEWADLEEWAKEYAGTEHLLEACEHLDIDEDIATGDTDEIHDAIREYIQDRGALVEFADGIIVSSF